MSAHALRLALDIAVTAAGLSAIGFFSALGHRPAAVAAVIVAAMLCLWHYYDGQTRAAEVSQ